MKAVKSLIITLFALLLTGCYTQLQYSQKVKRITDREEAGGYAQNVEQEDAGVAVETDEEGVPIYYKDYAYAERYKDCGCNPYNVYNYYYGFDYYDPYLTLTPFYFHRWHPYYSSYRYPYWGSRFSFSITFGWGHPYYYDPFYYDPFYYDYYWHGYRPFAYNYYRYYGHYGYYN
ncbi:MAG: hypothetical protein PVH63_07770, partial [Balneolaceae bacterium]